MAALRFHCVGVSDIGLKRTNNEDAYILRPDLGFCALADGMGGAAAGEIASRIFIESSEAVFRDTGPEISRSDCVFRAFSLANQRIIDHFVEYPQHRGMGCTAELVAVSQNDVVIGHIGDSRTYRFRANRLKQMTKDHSFVQSQVDKGFITPAEARNHVMRHVILQAVGTTEAIELDVIRCHARQDDIFLLCSDGLTDMVDDQAMQKTLQGCGELSLLAKRLIEMAKAGGGADNITIILLRLFLD